MKCCPLIGKADRVTVIGHGSTYHFVPSNPWVAVGWRKPADIEVKLDTTMARRHIRLISHGGRRVHPEARRIDINDGSSIAYD